MDRAAACSSGRRDRAGPTLGAGVTRPWARSHVDTRLERHERSGPPGTQGSRFGLSPSRGARPARARASGAVPARGSGGRRDAERETEPGARRASCVINRLCRSAREHHAFVPRAAPPEMERWARCPRTPPAKSNCTASKAVVADAILVSAL
jgi:hypothetical protein